MKNEKLKRVIADWVHERGLDLRDASIADLAERLDDAFPSKSDEIDKLLPTIEKAMARIMPMPGIAFMVTKDELKAHLEKRARVHREKASKILEGPLPPLSPFMSGDRAMHGMPALTDAEKELQRIEMRKQSADFESAFADRFDFWAAHMTDAPGPFVVGPHELQQYEFVEFAECGVIGARAQYAP
jgi:hypothetical protein